MDAAKDALTELFTSGREFTYERGDTIIRAGDVPSGVYFIVSGWIKVYTLCNDGEANIVMSLRPGDVFPLAWTVTGIAHDVSFSALETSCVRRISREDFLQALKTSRTLSQSMLLIFAQYFFRLTYELENLHYRSARERVAFRLIVLAEQLGQRNGRQITINVRIPNEFIARSTNMTRETASREISRLNQKKLIITTDGHIIIPDLAALEREAGRGFNLPVTADK